VSSLLAEDEERVLAEERVTRHALAAFDALEKERVIGVFGDLQERGHRGEQVGDDFLHHRHERAALGQVDEFVVGRLLHSRWRG
jgi:hypothetical protein